MTQELKLVSLKELGVDEDNAHHASFRFSKAFLLTDSEGSTAVIHMYGNNETVQDLDGSDVINWLKFPLGISVEGIGEW